MDENQMTEAVQKKDSVALMYPTNQLKQQVRPLSETLSAFVVIKDTFFADR